MRMFKKKQHNAIKDDKSWWKDPRLGTDDDEGAYDYFACNKPSNSIGMCWSNCKCDDCSKESRLKRYGQQWSAYWYCYDGWDGDSGFICWKCLLKNKIRCWKFNYNKKRMARKNFRKEWKDLHIRLKQKGTDKETIKKTYDVLYKIYTRSED